jgi:LuxR family transcriptional regulator, maltose regulon positive regulatory protein
VTTPILATKLYIPPPRPDVVLRSHLIERLNEGLHRTPGVTLISAPVGYGKTTLVSEWVACCERPVAWLSLDEGDSDPARFLTYLVAAMQTLAPNIGAGVLGMLQAPQLPGIESILTGLLNEIAAFPNHFTLVLDDYHVIGSKPIDQALTFLLDHIPTQMHLVITSREDPNLPLARLRARGQLTELRAADLRFTPAEAAEFLNRVMSLNLSAEDIATLETRTEGWIAGLQLAALSMRGLEDVHGFIRAFAGDNRYIVDYLVEEVLQRQSERVRSFLLQTSILDRLSGPLCDAVTGQEEGIVLLETLERGNLFVLPLDDKRHWFRYHRLFADVLYKHLMEDQPDRVSTLHQRASEWYEHNDLEIQAFQHATAANDVERAERLMEGEGMPLQYRGAMAPVLHWLESLPTEVLDAKPSLWVTYASASSMVGKPISSIEEMLQAAEAALQGTESDDKTRDLIGHVAAIRAMLAIHHNQVDTMVAQSLRALEYLHPDNLSTRATTTWTLGYAYQLQGDRAAARRAYNEAITISQAYGNIMVNIAAATCLGQVLEAENQLYLAAESYRRVMQLAGDPPQPGACEAYLGLARVFYQWNDLDTAQQHAQQSLQMAQQMDNVATPAACGVMLARLKLAQGDVDSAAATLAQAETFVRQYNFAHFMPEVVAGQVITMLHQGNLAAAAHLAEKHELPISQARVYLARGDPSEALALLMPMCRQAEAKGWHDEQLKAIILEAIALHALGETEQAVQLLGDGLALAQPDGYVRIFVDEGDLMRSLLLDFRMSREKQPRGNDHELTEYVDKLLSAFVQPKNMLHSGLIEPLSPRELEVLQFIARGLSNREISKQLFLALNTVKGHNRKIFDKLQVQRRTEAVARARKLGLL